MTATTTTMDDLIFTLHGRDVERLRDFAQKRATDNHLAALVNSMMNTRMRGKPATVPLNAFTDWNESDFSAG